MIPSRFLKMGSSVVLAMGMLTRMFLMFTCCMEWVLSVWTVGFDTVYLVLTYLLVPRSIPHGKQVFVIHSVAYLSFFYFFLNPFMGVRPFTLFFGILNIAIWPWILWKIWRTPLHPDESDKSDLAPPNHLAAPPLDP